MSFVSNHLEAGRLASLPASGFYMPNFITQDEETAILSAIYNLPAKNWTNLAHRRLLSLPSQLTGAKRDTLIDGSMPKFLAEPILQRFDDLGLFQNSPHAKPNHCLVNEYRPGQGIMPHEDGPAYYPITATVSLHSHTVLNIYRKSETGEKEPIPGWRILQEPRSLLITVGDMYKDTLHGIEDIDVDEALNPHSIVNWDLLEDPGQFASGTKPRENRVSLTYRDVLKVTKLGGVMQFMARR